MHVAYVAFFQNPNDSLPDTEIYSSELRRAESAEQLGFDSVWAPEHHFTDYTMCPDPLQFLSYIAGRTRRVKLGTMVVVLPWHDPMRVAEQVSLLDHVSEGRLILGIGRGLAPVEYEGLRVDQNESRALFVEYAELIMRALETGYMEGGIHTHQPRRAIRPRPGRSFRGRTYAAANSPESLPLMARLGVGLLIIPTKPMDEVYKDVEVYRQAWREHASTAPPSPISLAFTFVDKDKSRARELGTKYIADYYGVSLRHYGMITGALGTQKGYEYYSAAHQYIAQVGVERVTREFAETQIWGTPAQVLEKVAAIREKVDLAGLMCAFNYGGMPHADVDRSLHCFVEHVMPQLQRWNTPPLPEPAMLPPR
jgi:alkanesulfonate monooxygenase SsuD/methylene tetrahydromethanopterin reductase-like flavin-dependent oxidoreductase (luciferase family)